MEQESQLHNYMEDLVSRVAESILAMTDDVCTCAQCQSDVLCLCLNQLPVRYHTGGKTPEALLEELDQDYLYETIQKVYQALDRVRSQPRHPSQAGPADAPQREPERPRNLMEDFVLQSTTELLADSQHSNSTIDRTDVAARVLDELPPKYVSTSRGAAFSRLGELDVQFSVQLLAQAHNAIKEVLRQNDRTKEG